MKLGFLLSFYHFLCGYYMIECEECHKARLLNLLLREGIMAYPRGGSSWLVSARHKKKLEAICTDAHAVRSEGLGLPSILRRYRSRVGLLAGAFAAALLIFLAQSVVWRVEVSGNESIPDTVIEENLSTLGFGEGSFMKGADLLSIANAYRLTHDEVAHMDIYCRGTVAHVRVIEAVTGEGEKEKAPASLVASRDAVIESFDISHGTVMTEVGAVVKKGDLLVSGIVDGAHEGRLLRAEGRVMGAVSEDILVEIPFEGVKNTVYDRKNIGFSIIFFGKSINICRSTGKMPPTYGTIEEEEILILPSGKKLPFSITKRVAVFSREEQIKLSETEALRLAYADLKNKLTGLLKDGTLVSKTIAAQLTEESCILKCTVTYITDVAMPQEIILP